MDQQQEIRRSSSSSSSLVTSTSCETSRDSRDKISSDKFTVDFNKESKSGQSLQDAFLKYKKQRQKELKRSRKRKDLPDEVRMRSRADPERMFQLRMMFLNQAKKYFGVPYARKYWTPEDAEYRSDRFLDCCGLVRQVLRDLKKDFGFRIGPWNQSYMCDTLPVTIEKEENMKPGDLVFISAIYHNEKTKKQKHNLTHVEIWLGDGVKTIGARWQKGKVQIFDSYRFNATSYHSPIYIFKSIDTWLMGICRSHCSEHTWKMRSELFTPSKMSVFYHQPSSSSLSHQQRHDDELEDEDASEADDDDEKIFIHHLIERNLEENEIRKENLKKNNLSQTAIVADAQDDTKNLHHDSTCIVTLSHDPCISTSHDPCIATSHDPCIATSHDLCISTSHDPWISLSHNPCISTSHDPCISTSHDMCISTSHDPCISTSHDLCISMSHDPCISISHDPCISMSHDPCISISHDLESNYPSKDKHEDDFQKLSIQK